MNTDTLSETIDHSVNKAVFYFIMSALVWLVLSSAFALISGIKTFNPLFLCTIEGFTFGRIQAMLNTSMLMGWCGNAIFAIAFWMMARLSSLPIKHGGLLLIAGVIWNLAVTFALLGIFIGDMTPFAWMEFPIYTGGIFLLAYTLIAVWGIVAFRHRQNPYSYVSQWYILGALLWFPWIFVIGQFFLNWFPLRGVLQAIVHAWYVNALFYLWLAPIALAACYYFIPKLANVSIRSYHLSALAFWTFAIFAAWSGASNLMGAPIPVWLITTSIVFTISLTLPLLIFGVNLLGTIGSIPLEYKRSIPLKYIVFGSWAFLSHLLIKILLSVSSLDALTHFTTVYRGHEWHLVYAFFSMVLFGVLYYLVPTLLKQEWKQEIGLKINFLLSASGTVILLAALYVGGLSQGLQFNNAELSFLEIAIDLKFWMGVKLLGLLLIALANLLFAINLFSLFFNAAIASLPKLNMGAHSQLK